jgi:hypothetical protein
LGSNEAILRLRERINPSSAKVFSFVYAQDKYESKYRQNYREWYILCSKYTAPCVNSTIGELAITDALIGTGNISLTCCL